MRAAASFVTMHKPGTPRDSSGRTSNCRPLRIVKTCGLDSLERDHRPDRLIKLAYGGSPIGRSGLLTRLQYSNYRMKLD